MMAPFQQKLCSAGTVKSSPAEIPRAPTIVKNAWVLRVSQLSESFFSFLIYLSKCVRSAFLQTLKKDPALLSFILVLWSASIFPDLESINLRSHNITIKFFEVLDLLNIIFLKSYKERLTSIEHWWMLLRLGCLRCISWWEGPCSTTTWTTH